MIFLPILHIVVSIVFIPALYAISKSVFTSTEPKLIALLYIVCFLYGFIANISKALQHIIQYCK